VGLLVLAGGANLTTQALKALVAGGPRPPDMLESATWPSGHMTAATTVALCCVLLAPARLRLPVAVLAAGWIVAIANAILITGSHHPSDVLAAMLVAGGWAALVAAGLRVLGPRSDTPPWRPAALAAGLPLVVLVAAVASAVSVAVLGRLSVPGAVDHLTTDATVAGGAALVALTGSAVGLGAALAAVRRP
jgi:hypothetical protein